MQSPATGVSTLTALLLPHRCFLALSLPRRPSEATGRFIKDVSEAESWRKALLTSDGQEQMQGRPLSLPKRAFLSWGWPADSRPHLRVSDQWICGSLPCAAAFIGSVSPPHWNLQEASVPPQRFPRGGR